MGFYSYIPFVPKSSGSKIIISKHKAMSIKNGMPRLVWKNLSGLHTAQRLDLNHAKHFDWTLT